MFRTKLITDYENNCLPTTELLNEYCQEQIRMIRESKVKNVYCASGKANKMHLEVLKYDKMSYLLKNLDNYDIKLELKYDKNSDIKYDINYDTLSDTAFLPYKAWELTSVFNN